MIRDYSPGSGMVSNDPWDKKDVGSPEYCLSDARWVFQCVESMRRGKLMERGPSNLAQWWADGFESKRRKVLE